MVCEECGLPIEECNRLALLTDKERRQKRIEQAIQAMRDNPRGYRIVRVPVADLEQALVKARPGDTLILG